VDESLKQSIDFCRRLTRQEAGNFYFSFLTLPRAKRDAMCAIYAWMRRLDDLSDEAPSADHARRTVEEWRKQTHAVLINDSANFTQPPVLDSQHSALSTQHSLLWPAFADTVRRYDIPHCHFDEIAEGALMDQKIQRYETFQELYRYCYRVASVVGLVCLRVFGYTNPQAEKHGEFLGIAFQLTNILRDVREDAGRGRIYLPLEDLRRHGVSESDILQNRWSEPLHEMLKAFADRAEKYYLQARPVVDLVSENARPTLRIMTEIYHGILVDLRRLDFRVFEHRARLPTWKKIAIVAKHQLRLGMKKFLPLVFLAGLFVNQSILEASSVTSTTVSFPSGAEQISAKLVAPEGNSALPAVILVHEWWGLRNGSGNVL